MNSRQSRLQNRLRKILRGESASSGVSAPKSAPHNLPRVAVPPAVQKPLPEVPPVEPTEENGLLVWRETLDGESKRAGAVEWNEERVERAFREADVDAERLAFVDIETCGLADLPVFLVGVLSFD
ncbi:MAG: hypothetical protein AAF517_04990, partial [Planctomycetota bacterium]